MNIEIPKNKYTSIFLGCFLFQSKKEGRVEGKELIKILLATSYKEKGNFENRVINPIMNDLQKLNLNFKGIKEKKDYIFKIDNKFGSLTEAEKQLLVSQQKRILQTKIEFQQEKTKQERNGKMFTDANKLKFTPLGKK